MAAQVTMGTAVAAVAVPLMNAADGLFTAHWVAAGQATEANPLMAACLTAGPAAFAVTKMALAVSGTLVLLGCSKRFAARAGLACMAATYATVCAYHLHFAFFA